MKSTLRLIVRCLCAVSVLAWGFGWSNGRWRWHYRPPSTMLIWGVSRLSRNLPAGSSIPWVTLA